MANAPSAKQILADEAKFDEMTEAAYNKAGGGASINKRAIKEVRDWRLCDSPSGKLVLKHVSGFQSFLCILLRGIAQCSAFSTRIFPSSVLIPIHSMPIHSSCYCSIFK